LHAYIINSFCSRTVFQMFQNSKWSSLQNIGVVSTIQNSHVTVFCSIPLVFWIPMSQYEHTVSFQKSNFWLLNQFSAWQETPMLVSFCNNIEWSKLSKAFDKSKEQQQKGFYFPFSEVKKKSLTRILSVSVEWCFLFPLWWRERRPVRFKKSLK
jgi:hypothetical protein